MNDSQPIAVGASSHSSLSLPEPLRQLLNLRVQADSALNHPSLEVELAEGTHGQQAQSVRQALEATILKAQSWKSELTSKLSAENEARGTFVEAWALGRIGEYDGTSPSELPLRLQASLERYQAAARLLNLAEPPLLDQVPSVTRPKEGLAPLVLPEVASWVGEMLAEWARTQTTLAFSSLLLTSEQVIDEASLADLLDMACRRNVQALFTPLDPTSPAGNAPSSEEAGTVMGNARLIRDMSTLMPFSSAPSLWARRIHWATHVADVRFVEASMSANRLVDAASAAAAVLQDKTTDDRTRNEVRQVLEATIRRLVPYERAQGGCLLVLGRVMLEAVGALYLGRDEALLAERRRRDSSRDPTQEEEEQRIPVPENELVRETRQVFIRAAGLFENAYASFLRTPQHARSKREERRLLRRLETTYCNLEELDNETPEVVQLRSERVERALWINDRLLALGDNDDDEADDESDAEGDGADEDSDEELGLSSRLGRSTI